METNSPNGAEREHPSTATTGRDSEAPTLAEILLRYALTKKVPDMRRGFRIETNYGEIEIEAGPVADQMAELVRAELERQHAPVSMGDARTPEEARAWLDSQGVSISQWALDHGFHQSLVREILAGRKKFNRGQSHNIAVALGMKLGTPTDKPGRIDADQVAGRRRAAHAARQQDKGAAR